MSKSPNVVKRSSGILFFLSGESIKETSFFTLMMFNDDSNFYSRKERGKYYVAARLSIPLSNFAAGRKIKTYHLGKMGSKTGWTKRESGLARVSARHKKGIVKFLRPIKRNRQEKERGIKI